MITRSLRMLSIAMGRPPPASVLADGSTLHRPHLPRRRRLRCGGPRPRRRPGAHAVGDARRIRLAAPAEQVWNVFCNGCGEQTNVDPLLVALPDEYFFIVLSMTVTGAVAVWRWDAIFPDRRDYMNWFRCPSLRGLFSSPISSQYFSWWAWSHSTSMLRRASCSPQS